MTTLKPSEAPAPPARTGLHDAPQGVSHPASDPKRVASYRGAAEAVLTVMALGAALVAGWPITVAVTAPMPVPLAPVTAHVTGMLAGYGVLVLLVLMSRWPLLERGIGSDRLARWHAAGGRIVLTLVLVHAAAATAGWVEVTGLSALGAALDVLGMPGLVAATVATALMVTVAVISARSARRRLHYETWHGLHLSMYLAVALSFVHQLAGPDLAGRPVLQVLWALMYTHSFGLVLRYRVLEPIRMATRHRMRVAEVVPEADGVVSLVIEGQQLDDLQAEPGQFFRWRFLTPDLCGSPPTPSLCPRRRRLTGCD